MVAVAMPALPARLVGEEMQGIIPAAIPTTAEQIMQQVPQPILRASPVAEATPVPTNPVMPYDDDDLPPPLQDSEKVVAVLTGLRIDADLKKLVKKVGDIFGVPIVKQLAVWNKNSLLVEFQESVNIMSHLLVDESGVFLGSSPIDRLDLAPPSRTLNLRVFIMDPQYDFEGTPAQIAAHKEATKDWKGSKSNDVSEIRRMVEEAGGRACCVIVPKQPRMISSLEPQRCYTQLLFKYNSIDGATRIMERIDGMQGRINNMRITLRASTLSP
eukprot:Hpha_TRINITY_DN16574_c0_g9::TRINITY_DN16574_c0_g9_i1::g.136462::m.136462